MNALAIVAYRNPAEEWMWESGAMQYVVIAMLVGLVVAVLVQAFSGRRK